MATSKGTPQEAANTNVLLKRFPLVTHRAMKAVAAVRGVRVVRLYAEACEAFLKRTAQKGE